MEVNVDMQVSSFKSDHFPYPALSLFVKDE
jgi:hypothetical protein